MLDKIINDNTEYSRTAKRQDGSPTMYWILKEDVQKYIETENIYFLSGWDLSEKKEIYFRFKDHEIKTKNYFAIDIDLRNQIDWTITNLEIVQEGLYLAKRLSLHNKLFWQWSYIIFSWNGLHIYYVWKENTFNTRQFKLWVQHIFKMWDNFIDADEFKSDHACCNLARILRLPGSINQKNWAKVQILAEQDSESELFNNIKLYSLIEGWAIMMRDIATQKLLKQKKYDEWDDLYQKINSIPAHDIAMRLIPDFPFNSNWKNFNNKKWWLCWYYYVKDTNSICNWWSRYFNYWEAWSCFAPFQIIKNWYSYTNAETFEYFKNNFNL